jgi:2-(1,2-epoxy-1,2-dihydrophenyl)acetyl-CoA isomerase
MTDKRIKFSVADGIARITFANPSRNNAMDMQFCHELGQVGIACETTPDIRVIVVDAEGEMFSVGGDIDNFVANKHRVHPHILDMATQIHIGVAALRRAPAPVIMSIQGMAAGGAFSFVAGADVVIAGRSAKFNSAFTRSGLTPDAGGTYFFPRVAGYRKAFWIMATNPTLTAEQAEQIGLVSIVVDDDKLVAETEKVARQFADMPSEALCRLKTLFRASLDNSLDEQLSLEARSVSSIAATPTTLAKLEAFVAKRK